MSETPLQLQLLLLLSMVAQVYFPSGVVPKLLVMRGWKAMLGEPCKSCSVLPRASDAGAWTRHPTTCYANWCIYFYFLSFLF